MRNKQWKHRIFGVPFYSCFADGASTDDDGADKGTDKGDGKDDPGKAGKDSNNKDDSDTEEKKFTQSDIDDAVEKRLAREKRKWEREHPEAKKAEDDKKDSGKDDKAADDDSAEKLAAVNKRLVQSEAKAVALSLGVKPERVAYAVRMADLSKVDVDDELGVDGDAIKKALENVLKDIPELKATEDKKKQPGFKVGADGDKSGNDKKTTFKDAVAAYYKK